MMLVRFLIVVASPLHILKQTGGTMLYDFLIENKDKILASTEMKTLNLKTLSPNSNSFKSSLPIFYNQLISALKLHVDEATRSKQEDLVTREAQLHGSELMKLGYTLPHVVYTYGTLCQAIKEIATEEHLPITGEEFKDLNHCLDIAIAGAITGYELSRTNHEQKAEIERLGFLAHELRNALSSVNISLQLIKRGTVGFDGTTGKVLGNSLKRIEEIIDRSLTEVRLKMDPMVRFEKSYLLQIIDQIVMTAEIEAKSKNQKIEVRIDPNLIIEADQHLFYSAISNIIQNAIKYTHVGGTIQIRANIVKDQVTIEVEDECGGLSKPPDDLFKPFKQHDKNRMGIGLGLTIAQRAIVLNQGTIEVIDRPGKGCIFKIALPCIGAHRNLDKPSSQIEQQH